MCGIAGYLLPASCKHDFFSDNLLIDLNHIAERGPDNSDLYTSSSLNFHVLIAHTRLSIIDVSIGANQPMGDANSEWVISYNGEIYNYEDVRNELIACNWSFHTQSDSEVLLKAWSQWGLDALPRLNGMFAFVVHSKKTGETWLVRDRFGVKPLLYGRLLGGGLVFSSSIAAVAQAIDAKVNVNNCAQGLRFKTFDDECDSGSSFSGVHSIKAGGWLRLSIDPVVFDGVSNLALQEGLWYNLTEAVSAKKEEIAALSDLELLEQCQYLLQDAVKLRLRSDVPLAVSLSGGLDSTTVAALASDQLSDLHGFTFGSPRANLSEGPIVDCFTKQNGIKPHYIWPSFDSAGLDALLERTLCCQEAPFPGLSVMAQNEIFRNVKHAGFKVLLGGQGGDEIFAGYRKFFVVATRHAIRKHDAAESLRLLYSLGLMLVNEAGQARVFSRTLSRYRPKSHFAFNLLDWSAPTANLWGSDDTTLTERQIEDVQRWSIPTLLRYEDRNSMGYGVETRLPFMDYRLVELALALPARLKIANGYGKWAIRKITEGVVPDYIRMNRKKRGFDVTQNWIANGLGRSLRTRIHENREILYPHMKNNLNIDKVLNDVSLQANSNLLDEALMLAWLAQPVRQSKALQSDKTL
jgi:asparagine synthase (glutamine-hydrolysing)